MSQSESCANVWDWLCVLRLEQYSEAFHSAGLTTLQQCRNITPDQLDRMGITLPGHQRRILASLNKTHSNHDTQSLPAQTERSEETSHAQGLQRERPVPVPVEEKPFLEKRDVETQRPNPREREKPVPKERQVYRLQESSREGGGPNPVPGQRQTPPRRGKGEEKNGGLDGEREKPVPKERTKFRSSPRVDCQPSPHVSPTCDTSLPPVPPRSTPNCPPQRFTSPLSPSSPAQTPGSPKTNIHAGKALAEQCRSVSPSFTPISSSIPTQAPVQPSNLPSTPPRPQTLAIQPLTQLISSDGGRKSSPVSPSAFPINDKNAPPLPPKVGSGPTGPPPVPQRFPTQSPRSHR